MDEEKRNNILNTMVEIGDKVDLRLEESSQERGNIAYYKNFAFKGSNFGIENVYIVETPLKKDAKIGDKEGSLTIYEIYDKDQNLIATVTEEGKVNFTPEYLEELKEINPDFFKQLNLKDLHFELPKELEEDDLLITKEELKRHKEGALDKSKEDKKTDKKAKKLEEGKEEKGEEEENKEEVAKALGIKASEVKAVCRINPRQKISDKYNLIDIMPEVAEFDEITIAYSDVNQKGNGKFTILGISNGNEGNSKNRVVTQLNSIQPIEGVGTNKSVISVNEDGSEVTDKQVKGLFRINSRGRDDGISVSIGDYGMIEADYVSNVMDKEHRRSTPIKTKGPENVRETTAQVRENAGDSLEEVEKEGRIYRERQEEGIDSQTLDGMDTDEADGGPITLEELKENIKEEALEQGNMSREETREFIEDKLNKSGLELTEAEKEYATEEIEEKILDESRFPRREF